MGLTVNIMTYIGCVLYLVIHVYIGCVLYLVIHVYIGCVLYLVIHVYIGYVLYPVIHVYIGCVLYLVIHVYIGCVLYLVIHVYKLSISMAFTCNIGINMTDCIAAFVYKLLWIYIFEGQIISVVYGILFFVVL